MADIFDQVASQPAPKGDIFDQVAAPAVAMRASDALPQPDEVDQHTTAIARAVVSAMPPAAPPPANPSMNAGMSAQQPGLLDRIFAPIREGAIGRAFGMSSETAESRKEDPSNPLIRFEADAPHPGVGRAVAQFASGLTTPENMLLAAGTGGLGALEGQLGKGLVSRLVSAGFSASMLHEAYQQIPSLRDAWNKEDWPQVRQTLTRMTLGAGMAALGARHAVKGGASEDSGQAGRPVPPEQQYTSTGEPIRAPQGGDIFDQVAQSSKESTNAETKVQANTAQGKPVAVAQSGEPATAAPATGPVPADGAAAGQAPGAAGEAAVRGTIEPHDSRQPTAAVDPGAARAVDAAGIGEGRGDHGSGASGARQIPGEDTDIAVPGEDRAIRARYEVRELADLQPSHNGQTFLPNPKYPYRNERDYSKTENQGRVIEQSSEEKFNPRYHITDNPDAVNGPTMVDEDGNAFGGNSRLMSLQRVYGRKGAAAAGYRALLEKKAAQYGIDPAAVRGMKEPVLVRAASNQELASLPGGHKWAIRNTNVSGVAALSPSERAAADAGQLHPDLVQHIANAMDDVGPDATLNDALTGKSGPAIGNRLIHEGFFKEQERGELMDGKTGALTQAAKDRISKAMMGQLFRDSDQIARTPASIRNKLERIAAPVAKLSTNPEFDLRPDIHDAVDAMEYKQAQGFPNYEDAYSQAGMFGAGDNPVTPRSAYFARIIEEFTPSELTSIMRKYATNSVPEHGMFGSYEPTPKQAMADAVRSVVSDQEAAALAKIDKKLEKLKEGGATWQAAKTERAETVQRFAGRQRELGQRADSAFAVERPKDEPPAAPSQTPPPPNPPAAGPSATAEPAPPAPEQEPPASSGPTYMGSGLGALEPLFRESQAEGDALRARRDEALAAAKAARDTPGEKNAGEKVRSYLTSERDLWAARTNQALDVVKRMVLPKIADREAVAIAREFRHQPLELQAFIDGSHPFLQDVDGGASVADKNLAKLIPVLRQALRILSKPTLRERAADAVMTHIATEDLAEGRKGGWLESRWQPDQYVPHLLNPKGEGDVAKLPATTGRAMGGKVGKFFGFGERRSDRYPTMVHAVADGVIPKTLDPVAAFTVHADQFARARATHLLEAHLAETGLGKWGDKSNAPEGWVQLAEHTDEFKKRTAYAVPNSFQPETGESELQVGTTGLYVPPFLAKALGAITDPDYTARIPGFATLRTMQRGLKEAILGMSGFHLLTENFMAKADMGPSAMYRAFQADRDSPAFHADERDLIGAGGTTSIQGSTMDAYRGLQPGTIPTRAEVVRAYIPGSKQALQVADAITRFTFDNVQRRFKVQAFALHRDAWIHDNPTGTPAQLGEAKKGIASYVNGVYGGLHWENMGISRAMVEVARAFFLAPDWSGSNIALAKYAMDARPATAELRPRSLGGSPLTGAVTKEAVQARLARAFWVKQVVQGLTENQMLSLLFSGRLSPRPFQVYQGKDKNGADIYQNVVFRGSAGDLVNLATKMEEHGLLAGVGAFVGSKAAPVTKFGIHAITGRDDFGREISRKGLGVGANTARSAVALGSDLLPIPIIGRTIERTMLGDGADKYLWSERVLSLFGPVGQHVAPEGMEMGGNGELREKPYSEPHSFLEQFRTGRP